MKVCMVTPHLPPDQAANALLPALLGDGLRARGHEVSFIAFEPRYGRADAAAGVLHLQRPANGWARRWRVAQAQTALELLRKGRRLVASADVVHLHSNTFMNQIAAALARSTGRPFLLTHYGTEIWHYRKRRPVDPFLWMNRRAAHVTYYSRLLLERSLELGVAPRERSVIYPPVEKRFRAFSVEERAAARRELGLGDAPLLLNVKRLHPLAGQVHLIEAMPEIRKRLPGALLWIAGEGEARPPLERRIRELALEGSVRLLGLVDHRELPRIYAAADVFVLPSSLEAFPTVAAEALASGLPVVATDSPGGVELRELFPRDVRVTPRGDSAALAVAVLECLSGRERASGEALSRIERDFRPDAAVEKYLALYRRAAHA